MWNIQSFLISKNAFSNIVFYFKEAILKIFYFALKFTWNELQNLYHMTTFLKEGESK